MTPDEPIAHIARSPLPWRDPADNDTECGKHVSQFAKVISWDAAVAMVKDLGQQRASLFLCVTCCETANRYGWRIRARTRGNDQLTFAESPTERVGREFGKRREQMDAELRAMGELVARHRDEFDDLISGAVVPIAELRRQRGSRPAG